MHVSVCLSIYSFLINKLLLEDAWVVPDDTELADKIKSLVRRWNPVLDEHGNLIDVEWDGTEEPKPPEPEPTTEDILNALLGVTV